MGIKRAVDSPENKAQSALSGWPGSGPRKRAGDRCFPGSETPALALVPSDAIALGAIVATFVPFLYKAIAALPSIPGSVSSKSSPWEIPPRATSALHNLSITFIKLQP